MATSMLRLNLRLPLQNVRRLSQQSRPPSFLSKLIDNIRQEMSKNKEMKESLKKFREEAEKLENTEALQKAREKFKTVESEAAKGSDILKDSVSNIREKMQGVIEEAQKTEFVKKAGQITEEIGKATESIVEKGQKISQSAPFKTISQTAEAVKKEIELTGARIYRSPAKLRKRKEYAVGADEDGGMGPTFTVNTEATGIELHKDSKFYQSWQNFKDNNPYVNKVLDWKNKYDESENPVIRASRLLTEKVSDVMGGLFQKTELSEALTEICKIDPNFSKEQFLQQCEYDIIPNILEAMVRGELAILKDWCHEAAFNVLATPIKQAQALGYVMDCKVLDVDNVDIAMGKVMEQGPVLIISFTAQQIMCVRDKAGSVVEGDPEKVLRVNYVWVLCRDQTELDPTAAWRLIDLSAHSSEQLI